MYTIIILKYKKFKNTTQKMEMPQQQVYEPTAGDIQKYAAMSQVYGVKWAGMSENYKAAALQDFGKVKTAEDRANDKVKVAGWFA